MILAIINFKKIDKPDLLGKFPFSHIWANRASKWAKNGPKRGFIFFDKTFHLIVLEIVENERLLHDFIAQAPHLTKSFFLGDFPKCSSPIRLHDSSNCIISIKSSVNDLCLDFLQIVWGLWKLQIDYVLLVWYDRTYPDILKVFRKS